MTTIPASAAPSTAFLSPRPTSRPAAIAAASVERTKAYSSAWVSICRLFPGARLLKTSQARRQLPKSPLGRGFRRGSLAVAEVTPGGANPRLVHERDVELFDARAGALPAPEV